MAETPEVTIVEKRIDGLPALRRGGSRFESMIKSISGAVTAGAMYPAELKTMAKLRSAAKPVKEVVRPVLSTIEDLLTPKPFYPIVKYVPPTQPMPVVTVTAKRLGVASRFVARGSLPITVAEGAGWLARKIFEEATRRTFDELGQKLTRTVEARPDTKVKTTQTFEEQPIEEIVATASRSMVRPRPVAVMDRSRLEQMFNRSMLGQMQRDMLQSTLRTGVSVDPVLATVAAPTVPKVKKTPVSLPNVGRLSLPGLSESTMTRTGQSSRTRTLTLPFTRTQLKRSTLLGIGTGTATGVLPSVGLATSLSTQSKLSQITRVGQATKYCQPCPRRKKKRRSKCYRQLVKQGRYAARDKINKWAQIDCDTGKTIKELI